MPVPRSILFVCKGNICRSPLAEGIIGRALREAGLEVEVDSAGTEDYHVGEPPDPRAIAAAREVGVDIRALRARQLHRRDFERFDLVLVADRENLDAIRRRHPALARKPALLLDWCGMDVAELPDPYEGDAGDFARVVESLQCAAEALIGRLRAERREGP